jgi:hypothetical protein
LTLATSSGSCDCLSSTPSSSACCSPSPPLAPSVCVWVTAPRWHLLIPLQMCPSLRRR